MRWALLSLVAASACGRIGFELLGDPAGTDDAGQSGDGAGGLFDSPETPDIDALPPACAEATVLIVNDPVPTSTCSGQDRLDACGPAGTEEVVFRLNVASTGTYTFQAWDPGTMNVSNTTGIVSAGCAPLVNDCAGVTQRDFTQGEVVYVAVEASSGGCASIEFEVTQ